MRSTAAVAAFEERTGRRPEGVWAAPGRVNLIGDHTDHSGGNVLPFAIDRHVVAAASARDDGLVRAWSLQEPAAARFTVGSIRPGDPDGWAAYVAGVVWSLGNEGVGLGGLDVVVDGAVAPGAGLGSSAALGCAVALAVAELHDVHLEPVALALLAQRAEVEVVGVPCGVMDQMASTCGREGQAMFLDTRSLERRHVPLEVPGASLVLIETGTRRLVEGAYARRRAECDEAARSLGLASLRDASPSDLERLTDDTLLRRARHVVTENRRVTEAVTALQRGDGHALGRLMTASHASLRDDFEVSTEQLEAAVAAAAEARAHGARLTGAGFGGSVIALVPSDRLDELRARLHERGLPAGSVVRPVGGAHRVG
jgi:galactokinase